MALGPDKAVVIEYYFLGNGKTDAGALVLVAAMQAGKDIKDALGVFGRKANTIVVHFDEVVLLQDVKTGIAGTDVFAGGETAGNFYFGWFAGTVVFQGVADKVLKQL